MMLPGFRSNTVNVATAINFLAGLWLVGSQWIFAAAASDAGAWNAILAGTAIALVAVLRSAAGPRWATLSWLNALLGAWTIASPWIFLYVDQGDRAWNSAVLGVLVVVLACFAETAPEAWGSDDNAYRPAPGWDYAYSVRPERPGEPAIWYASTNYGQAGLGDPERENGAWSSAWRRWLFGRSAGA